jgi:hypothetical protein
MAGYLAIRDLSFWLDTTVTGRDIKDTRSHFTTTYTAVTGVRRWRPPLTTGSPSASVVGTASPLAAVTYHLSMPANLDNKNSVIFKMSHSINDKSSVFFAAQDDGSRSLPTRDAADGKYHVPGDLVVADHPIIKNLINNSIPLLRAGGDCEKIILSPLPRYLKE